MKGEYEKMKEVL